MMWAGKEISQLDDAELKTAADKLASMASMNDFAKASLTFKKRMGNRTLQSTNPNFLMLQSAISTEIEKRKSNG